MELLQLRYFRALAEEEHLSKTAEALMISQPALSLTIKKLENELGVKLFDREGRGIKLNDNGRLFFLYIKNALDSIDAATAELSRRAAASDDHLKLGIMSPYAWQDLTCEFATLHPEIVLSQRSVEDSSYVNMLLNGEIDFHISNIYADEDKKGKDGLEYMNITEDAMVLVVPENSHLATKQSVRFSELRSEAFISRPPRQTFQLMTDSMCKSAGFTPRVSMICDYTTREAMVASGGGLSFTSYAALRWLNQPGVRTVRISDETARFQHQLIWKKDREFTESMKIFMEFVKSKNYSLLQP